jgi:hypothetical protein
MSSDLEKNIHEFKTPFLLEQFHLKREDYSAEALAIMEREIASRSISDEEMKPYRNDTAEEGPAGDPGEFKPFDHTFSQTDILLAHAILRDAGIPFFIERPAGDTVVPLEGEADRRYTIQVASSQEQRAHELLNEHFHREDGKYRLKHTEARDRLKLFSFAEVRFTEMQMAEEVEADLTAQERQVLAQYARRLQEEIESFDAQERVVFYFDNIEELLARLGAGIGALRLIDLLTIVEIMQIYCDDPQFPAALVQSSGALLDMFEK